MANERVVLVDGSSLIYRAFFAIPNSFRTTTGIPTNATYGFATMFRKLAAARDPSFAAVVFDAPGGSFRDEKFPAYKAQRPRMPSDLRIQLPWIDRVVDVHGYPRLRVEGYEADDVIGTLARQAVEAGHEVVIVSGDKDFAQLIGPDIRMLDTMRDVTYDAELVRKKWGVPPDKFIDFLALVGDKVDNVPGVPGIGKKTAVDLLDQFDTLEGVLAHTDQLKGKRRENLEAHSDQARLSRELVTIDQHAALPVDLEGIRVSSADPDAVVELFRELEFFSLLPEHAGDDPEALEHVVVRTADELADMLDGPGPIAVEPIWAGASAVWGTLAGIALGRPDGEGAYIPLVGPSDLADQGAQQALRTFLTDAGTPKVVHDLRDVWTILGRHGWRLDGVVTDTQLVSFLVDPTANIPHRLDQVARAYLARPMAPEKSVRGSGRSEADFVDLDVEEVVGWAAQRAATIAELAPVLTLRLDQEGQRGFLDDVAMPLSRVLADMQLLGIRVDGDILSGLQVEFAQRRDEIEGRVHELAGHDFNLGSTKQLGEVLFDELGLPVLKRTKTGYSTAADVLERLAPQHEIAALVLRWRALAKLVNTYTRVLREAIQGDGRVHCTIQQTTGASGRLITTEPDLQRTPIRTEDGKRIREAFIPRQGWVIISADWSQIELRLLAHVSGDDELRKAFSEGVDLHRRTAAALFDVDPLEVDSAQRNAGKTVNFATIYGQGATALAQQLGVPRSEAKRYIERYFELYAGVRAWIDRTVVEAKACGYVETLLGRRRYVTELTSNNPTDRAYGERIAANTPIQGSAADICKLAMLDIARKLHDGGFDGRMLLQIHDELLFECPPEERDALVTLVRKSMELVVPLSVPLQVDVGWGASWAEAH